MALRISFPMENILSTLALEGMAVLYFTKSLAITGSPRKVASQKSFLEPMLSQVARRVCALLFDVDPVHR